MGRRRRPRRRLAGEGRPRARRRPGRDRRSLPRGQGAFGRLLHDRLRLAGPRARGRGDVARRALDGNRGAARDDPGRRGDVSIEEQLRGLAPRVLGTLVRRYGRFDACEDAVQEALLDAALQWPRDGVPANPRGWLLTAAHRRLIDELRSESARRRREEGLAREPPQSEAADEDDTLELLFMCCHESLTPASQVALTLRAVGGLTTAEIASAFLVPESTMAQRISRAKATIRAAGARFLPPAPEALAVVLHVLYLIFNEGYMASSGAHVARVELSAEAIRLTRGVHRRLPDDGEVAALLALMLLTDARRPARARADGSLVPLAEQDRTLWAAPKMPRGSRWSRRRWRASREAPTSFKPRSPRSTTRRKAPGRPTGGRSLPSTRSSSASRRGRWSRSTEPSRSRWSTVRARDWSCWRRSTRRCATTTVWRPCAAISSRWPATTSAPARRTSAPLASPRAFRSDAISRRE